MQLPAGVGIRPGRGRFEDLRPDSDARDPATHEAASRCDIPRGVCLAVQGELQDRRRSRSTFRSVSCVMDDRRRVSHEYFDPTLPMPAALIEALGELLEPEEEVLQARLRGS